MVSFLDFKPYSSEVLDWDYLAFIAKPVPCPRDWGFRSFKDLSVHIVPCIPSITDRDSVFGSWFNHEWTSDCCKFRGEGKVCVESI